MLGKLFLSTQGDSTNLSDPTVPKFHYLPLQSPEFFRVLTISPGSGPDLIQGSLTNFYMGSGVQYEALSYHWGNAAADVKILVRSDTSPVAHFFYIRQNLEAALKRLRYPDRPRSLWIDAICIDQNDEDEKNAQIPRMADIFHNATSVCVWLGESADESAMAINFIKTRVLNLGTLDSLLEEQETDKEWAALSKLMRRPWFGRKWVIQEIGFAKNAVLHCGNDTISWNDLADAVALFTDHEAESKAVSRLLKGSKTFGHDADYFGDVKALGAAQLVDVTGRLFRKADDGSIQEHLLSLDYLVSSLATFGASQPHDAIYSLLALSRDSWFRPMREKRVSNPESPAEYSAIANASPGSSSSRTGSPVSSYYGINLAQAYNSPARGEPYEAFTTLSSSSLVTYSYGPQLYTGPSEPSIHFDLHGEFVEASSWNGSSTGRETRKRKFYEHDLLGCEKSNQDQIVSKNKLYMVDYKKEIIEVCIDFITFVVNSSQSLDIICRPWAPDVSNLPSWIPSLRTAPFGLRPDGHYTRINADSLVGLPNPGRRKYKTSEWTSPNWGIGQNPNLPYQLPTHGSILSHSIFVEGFILDTIQDMTMVALEGIIPPDWLELGGWEDTTTPPPERLWRTLIADRGPNGENPPSYYRRACQYAFGQTPRGGAFNPQIVISKGDSTIVTKFLRRLQSVVWMRRLATTTEQHFLGLVPKDAKQDDLVCVLYGCSVPVVLRKVYTRTTDNNASNVKPGTEGATSKARARIITRACSNCRRRKIRCSGEEPCRLCAKNSETCTYNLEERHKRHGTFYRVIGEAYIHGMMDGEAMQFRERGKQMFRLR